MLLDGETYPQIPIELADYIDNSLTVITKADLIAPSPTLSISAKTGQGIPALLEQITQRLHTLMSPPESPALTRARHRQHVEKWVISLQALLQAAPGTPPELFAENLRQAAHSVSALTGHIGLEDVLDHLFSQFCIGK